MVEAIFATAQAPMLPASVGTGGLLSHTLKAPGQRNGAFSVERLWRTVSETNKGPWLLRLLASRDSNWSDLVRYPKRE